MSFLNRFFAIGLLAGVMVGLGVALVVLAVLIAASKQMALEGPEHGLPPPAFPASADSYLSWPVRTLDGRHANLADFQEKVLFVNIWATWCGPCVWEMPAIEKLAERFAGEDMAFLVVSDEPLDTVRPFVEEKGWKLPVYVAQKRPPMFQTDAIPATFILDQSRRPVVAQVGSADWSAPSAYAYFDRLLAEQPPQPR